MAILKAAGVQMSEMNSDFLTLSPPIVTMRPDWNAYYVLRNVSRAKLAIKVKSTNTDTYKIRPVLAVLPPGGACPLEVSTIGARTPPAGTVDRMCIQFGGMLEEETRAARVFANKAFKFPQIDISVTMGDTCNGETEMPQGYCTTGEYASG